MRLLSSNKTGKTARPPKLTVALTAFAIASPVMAKDDFPVVLTKFDGRPGKTLTKAVYGRGGQLGAFYDVDADGNLEFVGLERDGGNLSLNVLQIDSDRYSLQLPYGKAAAAGLTAMNLDDDEQLEYIVAYGERLEGLKRGLVIFAGGIVGGLLAVPVASVGGHTIIVYPVLLPNSRTDTHVVMAVDDDGSIMWERDLEAEAAAGAAWDETRFKWVVADTDGSGGTILITDDAQQALIGLSAEDGRTLWSTSLQGGAASKKQFVSLLDSDRQLPVLFEAGRILAVDPDTGSAELDIELKRRILEFPTWYVFDVGGERAFLAHGDKKGELLMVSLDSGDVLWSQQSAKILDVVVTPDGKRFIKVLEKGIEIYYADGTLDSSYDAPEKIKAKYPPVYKDLNGDGQMEFVFVSGKNIFCWQLDTDKLRWEAGMRGFVGGANPTELFGAFYDIDGDGWLDVPARKGGGTGRWLSGDTGEILTEVGNGATQPIVGDWDGNGKLEMFWYKHWYEVSMAR